jgi:hypothetical protein
MCGTTNKPIDVYPVKEWKQENAANASHGKLMQGRKLMTPEIATRSARPRVFFGFDVIFSCCVITDEDLVHYDHPHHDAE